MRAFLELFGKDVPMAFLQLTGGFPSRRILYIETYTVTWRFPWKEPKEILDSFTFLNGNSHRDLIIWALHCLGLMSE